MSWLTTVRPGVTSSKPLVYLIRVQTPASEFRYVGKTVNQGRFKNDYQNNVKRLLAGKTKRRVNPANPIASNTEYRRVHLVLAAAVEEGWPIEHVALENAPRELLGAREKALIVEHDCNLNDRQRWPVEQYATLKAELLGGAA